MELRDIDYFATIAEHGHLGRAAEALGLGQPALSLSLRRLERVAGAALVERTARGVVLTALGSAVLERAQVLRLARDDFRHAVVEFGKGRRGHLDIGASPALAGLLLPRACAEFSEENPKVLLNVSVLNAASLQRDLINGKFHFALIHARKQAHPEIEQTDLCNEDLVVFCSSRHRLAKRKNVTLADLALERWVTTPSGNGDWLAQTFEKVGLPRPQMALLSDSVGLRFRTVASSNALGIAVRHIVEQLGKRLGLTILPYRHPDWVGTIAIGHRKSAYLSPAAQRFIQTFRKTVHEFAMPG